MVMTPQEARDLFPILQERAYLFSGGIAPATRRTLESIRKHLDDLTYDPDDLFFRTHEDFQQVRRLFAELMGADEKGDRHQRQHLGRLQSGRRVD